VKNRMTSRIPSEQAAVEKKQAVLNFKYSAALIRKKQMMG